MFKSTPKEHFTKTYFPSFKNGVEAPNCSGILLKRFLVQFYIKESQFLLINNVTCLQIKENSNIFLRYKRGEESFERVTKHFLNDSLSNFPYRLVGRNSLCTEIKYVLKFPKIYKIVA